MKPLLHILKHSDKVCKLKVSTMAFSHCCCGKSTNLTLTKASLNVLTRLLLHVDIDVLRHACWALFHLLDGLQNEEVVRSVMKTQYFLQHVIHLLKRDLLELEQPILKSLHLITKVGCADLIARCNGIAAISKTLSTTHEENRKSSIRVRIIISIMTRVYSSVREAYLTSLSGEVDPVPSTHHTKSKHRASSVSGSSGLMLMQNPEDSEGGTSRKAVRVEGLCSYCKR